MFNEEVEVKEVPAKEQRPDPTALRLAAATQGMSSASGRCSVQQSRSDASSSSARTRRGSTRLETKQPRRDSTQQDQLQQELLHCLYGQHAVTSRRTCEASLELSLRLINEARQYALSGMDSRCEVMREDIQANADRPLRIQPQQPEEEVRHLNPREMDRGVEWLKDTFEKNYSNRAPDIWRDSTQYDHGQGPNFWCDSTEYDEGQGTGIRKGRLGEAAFEHSLIKSWATLTLLTQY